MTSKKDQLCVKAVAKHSNQSTNRQTVELAFSAGFTSKYVLEIKSFQIVCLPLFVLGKSLRVEKR
jgi:hypothetical protein